MSIPDNLVPLSKLEIREDALRCLAEVFLPGHKSRDPLLPRLFRWRTEVYGPYPYRRTAPSDAPNVAPIVGETYFTFYDPSEEGRENLDRVTKHLKIPLGREAYIRRMFGLLKLRYGDWMVGRATNSNGDIFEDIVQVMVSRKGVFRDKEESLLRLSRDILGTKEERERADGRTRFEQRSNANRVRKDDRAYPLAVMSQQPTSIAAPAACLKTDGTPTEYQKIERAFLHAATDLTTAAFETTAPDYILEPLRDYSEAINAPRVGCGRNFAFPAWQMNLAPEQDGDAKGSLVESMAFFGDAHTDDHDAVTGYSCMTVLSDLSGQRGEEPGRFHFLGLGAFVTLEPLTVIFFSGRLRHGGTAPLAPSGKQAPVSAIRCVLIGYPSRAVLDGTARHTLAGLPRRRMPIYISPEMNGVCPAYLGADGKPYTRTNHANYASDGNMVMDPQSHVDFLTRSMLQYCRGIARTLPSDIQVEIDRDRFLGAFKFIINDEELKPTPWSLGPSGSVHDNPDSQPAIQRARSEYLEVLYRRLAPGIPTAPLIHPLISGIRKAVSANESDQTRVSAGGSASGPTLADGGDEDGEQDDYIDDEYIEKSKAKKRRKAKKTGRQSKGKAKKKPRQKPPTSDAPSAGESGKNLGESSTRASASTESRDPSIGGYISLVHMNENLEDGLYIPTASVSDLPYAGSSEEHSGDRSSDSSDSSASDSEFDDPLPAGVNSEYDNEVHDLIVELSARSEEQPGVVTRAGLKRKASRDEYELRLRKRVVIRDGDVLAIGESPSLNTDRELETLPAVPVASDQECELPSLDSAGSSSSDVAHELPEPSTSGTAIVPDLAPPDTQSVNIHKPVLTHAARAFIRQLTSEVCTREIHNVSIVTRQLGSSPIDATKAIQVLNEIDLTAPAASNSYFREHPLEVLCALRALRSLSRNNDVVTNIYRRRIMLYETHLGDTLADTFAQRCHTILSSQARGEDATGSTDTLSRLVWDIYQCVDTRQAIVLQPRDYFGIGIEDQSPYSPGNLPRYNTSARAAVEDVVAHTSRALRGWFGLPDTIATTRRATFVKTLCRVFDTGILFLPFVWAAYCDNLSWIARPVRISEQSTITTASTPCLEDVLRSRWVSTNLSKALKELRLVYTAFLDTVYQTLTKRHSDMSMIATPSISGVAVAGPNSGITSSADSPMALSSSIQPPVPSLSGCQLATPTSGRAQLAVLVLQAGLRASKPNTLTPDDVLASSIRSDTNSRQPLRELGSSRMHVNGGLCHNITGEVARGRSGRFSILVFRNILFNTDYLASSVIPLSDKKVYFEDVADFYAHMDALQEYYTSSTKESFFCNRTALSRQTILGRSITTAADYWKLACSAEWDALMDNGRTPTFRKMWQFLHSQKKKMANVGFGDLSIYLSAVDLAYAGVSCMPNADEVAAIVKLLNRGAVAGMRYLGYLPSATTASSSKRGTRGNRASTRSGVAEEARPSCSVETAFTRFYQDVSARLTDEEVEHMGWNPAVGEHTLCKVWRLRNHLDTLSSNSE